MSVGTHTKTPLHIVNSNNNTLGRLMKEVRLDQPPLAHDYTGVLRAGPITGFNYCSLLIIRDSLYIGSCPKWGFALYMYAPLYVSMQLE